MSRLIASKSDMGHKVYQNEVDKHFYISTYASYIRI